MRGLSIANQRAVLVSGRAVTLSGVPDDIIEDFEWASAKDLSEFYTDSSNWKVTESTPIQGEWSLVSTNNNTITSRPEGSNPELYDPKKGDIIEWYSTFDSNSLSEFTIGWADGVSGYRSRIGFRDGIIEIIGDGISDSLSVSFSDSLHRGEIYWHDGRGDRNENTLEFKVFEVGDVKTEGSLIGSVSITDASFETNRGIRWEERGSSGADPLRDLARRIGTVDWGKLYDVP